MSYPMNLKYTKEHEWAKMEGGVVTVGITDHAQRALGDVVYCELPAQGRVLKVGEAFGVVESIKAVSDLYAPVAGKVLEINQSLVSEPAQLNQDPHQSGWMIKLEGVDQKALDSLMSADEYTKYVESLN